MMPLSLSGLRGRLAPMPLAHTSCSCTPLAPLVRKLFPPTPSSPIFPLPPYSLFPRTPLSLTFTGPPFISRTLPLHPALPSPSIALAHFG